LRAQAGLQASAVSDAIYCANRFTGGTVVDAFHMSALLWHVGSNLIALAECLVHVRWCWKHTRLCIKGDEKSGMVEGMDMARGGMKGQYCAGNIIVVCFPLVIN
jgi:hypothetical protein